MIYTLHIVNILNIILAFVFQVIFVKKLGATFKTDAYYLSMTILQFVNFTVVGFITDLYIRIYNDIKVKDEEQAKTFSNAVFTLVLILGLVLSLTVFTLAPLIVKVFAAGFSADQVAFTTSFLRILSLSILFTFLITVINSTLNASFYILITYLTNLITPLFNILAILFLVDKFGIISLIYAFVAASAITFIVLIIYLINKSGVSVVNPFVNKDVRRLLKQNIPLRIGILVYLIRSPATTNIISYFPPGYITLYNYAERIILVLHDISNSIILQILYVKSCKLLSKGDIPGLKSLMTATVRVNNLFFILLTLPVIVFFVDVFRFLFSDKLSVDQIKVVFFLFVALLPFYLLMTIELPFTYITMAMKKGVMLLKTAIVFTLIYIVLILSGIKYLGIYAIPAGLLVAQIFNSAMYIKFVNDQLKILDKQIITTIFVFILLLSGLILTNAYLKLLFDWAIYLNIIWAALILMMVLKYRIFGFAHIKEQIQ